MKPYCSKVDDQWLVLNWRGRIVFSSKLKIEAFTYLRDNFDALKEPEA